MLLFLVRHGQSEFNLIGEEAGSDSPLTDLGRQQAERAGAWLAGRGPFDAIYSSPLRRAGQTTEIIGRHVAGPAPITLDALAESEFHLLHTLPQYAHPTAPFNGAGFPPAPPEYDAFRRQVASALGAIVGDALENAHERILIVSHGGTMGTIVRTLVGCHNISIWSMNCGVHCLGWTDNRWEIRFMNRTHFLKDDPEKA
jgi:broad specificity phosphatase PhoE